MQCPFCREAVPQLQLSSRTASSSDGHSQIRRGLLYMLLGAVVHYFAGGYGAPWLDAAHISNVEQPAMFTTEVLGFLAKSKL